VISLYDCSNSEERPKTRGNGGPVKNDIIRYLQEYAGSYGCQFVSEPGKADVFLTNDVFPSSILKYDRPRVKRMDGVFWDKKYMERNVPLNRAASQADHVIFISQYSQDSYFGLYGDELKSFSVCLNQADPSVFFNGPDTNELIFVATANSWEREEKRFNDIVSFAYHVWESIILIGSIPPHVNLPSNIHATGYLSSPEDISSSLRRGSVFVNFSYRDPAPKTVCQALCCGLPVLYANSGGVPELVEGFGVSIVDNSPMEFGDKTPDMADQDISRGTYEIRAKFETLREQVKHRDNVDKFKKMLDGYFQIFTKITSVRSLK